MLQESDYDSDTSDEDFVPEGNASESDQLSNAEISDEDVNVGNEEKLGKKRKKTIKKKKEVAPAEKEQEVNLVKCPEEEKKKADDIWADFLADTDEEPRKLKTKERSVLNQTELMEKSDKSSNRKEIVDQSLNSSQSTVTITQIFEFAGEKVRVEKEVLTSSVEAKSAMVCISDEKDDVPVGEASKKRNVGLSGVMNFIESKKQKLTTLEKTKLDWMNFKTEEGIDAELESHKKSKGGYLDKQDFLQRSDLKQYEIERSLRMSRRSNR